MTFSELVKKNADEKYLQLLSGEAKRSTPSTEITSCAEYDKKSTAFHKRLKDEETAVSEALKTVKFTKSEADKAEAERKKKEEAERKAKEAEKKKREEEKRKEEERKRKEEEDRIRREREALERAARAEREAQEKKKRTIRNIFIGALAVIAIVAIVITIVSVSKSNEYKRYSSDNIVLTIVDKCDPTESTSYYDGYVIAFDMNIKNNSVLDIIQIKGELVVYNANNKKLLTANCTFSSLNIGAGKEANTVLNIDCRENADILELYYADCDDLSATFKLTEVIYEGYDGKDYNDDPVTVLELKVGSDGISTTEKAYQEALALFNQGKYAEAASKFEALGLYKDSNDYYYQSIYNNALSLYSQEKYREAYQTFKSINGYKDVGEKMSEVTATVLDKAEAAASTGDYVSAYKLIEQVDFDEESLLHQAYTYASQGYFADAVAYGLTVVVIPEGVESIPDNYFKMEYSNNQLEKVVLPSTIKSIGASAFSGCTKLVEINLPNGLKTIGNNAFYKCKSLKTINMPDSVEYVGYNAFEECAKLESVTTSSGLTKILSYTFKNCTNLTTLTIKNGVEVIESSAFSYCSSLMNVTLPESLVEIQGSAFQQCTSLIEITIPSKVSTIGNRVFADCSALQRVYFANQVGWDNYGTKLDVSDAQKNAKSLKNVNPGVWERK